jgi:hypothetical protein
MQVQADHTLSQARDAARLMADAVAEARQVLASPATPTPAPARETALQFAG